MPLSLEYLMLNGGSQHIQVRSGCCSSVSTHLLYVESLLRVEQEGGGGRLASSSLKLLGPLLGGGGGEGERDLNTRLRLAEAGSRDSVPASDWSRTSWRPGPGSERRLMKWPRGLLEVTEGATGGFPRSLSLASLVCLCLCSFSFTGGGWRPLAKYSKLSTAISLT